MESKINSVKGMSTKFWGPALWRSLFSMILGGYPDVIDENNREHVKTRRAFMSLLCNLKYTLPCSFCRNSYKLFYRELPIKKYNNSRANLLKWLYLMKDKVNKKLIVQENEYIRTTKKECFRTIDTPKFDSVINEYLQHSARCSSKLKKCIKKTSKVKSK